MQLDLLLVSFISTRIAEPGVEAWSSPNHDKRPVPLPWTKPEASQLTAKPAAADSVPRRRSLG